MKPRRAGATAYLPEPHPARTAVSTTPLPPRNRIVILNRDIIEAGPHRPHKNGTTPGFTSTYGTNRLVWYEHRLLMEAAIRREKQLKAWKRDWKIELIESMNPDWRDLHDEIDALASLISE